MEKTDVYTIRDFVPEQPLPPPMEMEMQRLTFQDGFYFGCGFFVAGIIAYLALLIVVFLALLIFSVAFGTSFLTLLQ